MISSAPEPLASGVEHRLGQVTELVGTALSNAYAREELVYWYASIGKSAKDKVLQSEHLVSTTRYRAD